MKKIFQTDTTNVTGNCLQYAVASVFEMEPSHVPQFSPTDYLKSYTNFCNSQGVNLLHGLKPSYHLMHSFLNQTTELLAPAYCILGVKSFKHSRIHHAVVGCLSPNGYRFVRVVHDPNPENAHRKTHEYIIVNYDLLIPATARAEHLICELGATERG